MKESDFEALYKVLADADIMEHYPYTFDEARVRGWIARNLDRYEKDGFGLWAVYSCMKYTNIPSCRTALKNGMRFMEEYEDPGNTYTRVFAVNRTEWAEQQET